MFPEPIYIPRALNTGTCIKQVDLFYSAGLDRNHVLATANTGDIGRGFGKNAREWTGRVEISKERLNYTCSAVRIDVLVDTHHRVLIRDL